MNVAAEIDTRDAPPIRIDLVETCRFHDKGDIGMLWNRRTSLPLTVMTTRWVKSLISFSRRPQERLVIAVAMVASLSMPDSALAKGGLYHPVFVVISEQPADLAPQEAVVEPWILTDGVGFVFIHDYCNALFHGAKSPLRSEQISFDADWLKTVCVERGDVTLDGSRFFGINNRGETVTLGPIRISRMLYETSSTTVASDSWADARASRWKEAFPALNGFYVISPNEALLKAIVPVVETSANAAGTVFASGSASSAAALYVSNFERIARATMEGDWEFCSPVYPKRAGCVDGWYQQGIRPPNVSGPPESVEVRNAYFDRSSLRNKDLLVLGLEGRFRPHKEGAEPPRLSSIALLPTVGEVWARNMTFDGRAAQSLFDFSRFMFAPRATLRIGQCSYVATTVDSGTRTLALLAMPKTSKVCKLRAVHTREQDVS